MIKISTKLILAITLSVSSLALNTIEAVTCELDLFQNGHTTQVVLPFAYYERQPGDNLTMIHQGGYKVYDVANDSCEVAVMGPLRPCIAVAVTDGQKVVVFHKHSSNSLDHMSAIIEQYLDLSDSSNLYGRIFTTRDDVEWQQTVRGIMHANKTHTEAVVDIKNALEVLGFKRSNVPATLFNLRTHDELNYADGELGYFEFAETTPCLCLSNLFAEKDGKIILQFFSIDPVKEDAFGYKGTMITQRELAGEQKGGASPKTREHLANSPEKNISFDDIPKLYFNQMGRCDGYRVQRGIVERFMDSQNDEYYMRHFGKKQKDLFTIPAAYFMNGGQGAYNTLEFFEIDGKL